MTKRRTDNMPDTLTAHVVRFLTVCTVCGGLGDRRLMIYQNTHTSCFVESNGFKGLKGLSRPEIEKLRLCDISTLTHKQRQALFAHDEHRCKQCEKVQR